MRRRDSLLGTYPLITTPDATDSKISEGNTLSAVASPSPATEGAPITEHTVPVDSTTPSPEVAKPPLSPSQEVAQSVLAGQPTVVPPNAVNTSQLARLKAASSTPEGSTDNPIQVSIVERSLLDLSSKCEPQTYLNCYNRKRSLGSPSCSVHCSGSSQLIL